MVTFTKHLTFELYIFNTFLHQHNTKTDIVTLWVNLYSRPLLFSLRYSFSLVCPAKGDNFEARLCTSYLMRRRRLLLFTLWVLLLTASLGWSLVPPISTEFDGSTTLFATSALPLFVFFFLDELFFLALPAILAAAARGPPPASFHKLLNFWLLVTGNIGLACIGTILGEG